jgi:hypothetical protein
MTIEISQLAKTGWRPQAAPALCGNGGPARGNE